jgi:putative MATE family efflux protein
MNQSKMRDLTQGSVKKHILNLSYPMTIGMIGMIIFNLVDAYYIGKLGVEQLAAIAFTFPVVLVVNSMAAGIGLGSSVLLSKFVGKRDLKSGRELIFTSFLLGLLVNVLLMTLGMLTIDQLFSLLGAEGMILTYIKQYMIVWFAGLLVLVIPQIGNNLIRALGDTKTPSLVMGIAAITNVFLDPLFIFGYGPIPGFGVRGAAIATVISRSITMIATIYILGYREKIFKWMSLSMKKILQYWKKILFIGIPNALIQIAVPIGLGIITRILSSYGNDVVAGFGIASKIEIFALAYINALAIVIGPFVGQNYGAKSFKRIEEAVEFSTKLALGFGLVSVVILLGFAESLAGIFTDNERVVASIVKYLTFVPIGYGLYGIMKMSVTVLNVLNRPVTATVVIGMQVFGIYIPLALLGSKLIGIEGVFGALPISYLVGALWGRFQLQKNMKEFLTAKATQGYYMNEGINQNGAAIVNETDACE